MRRTSMHIVALAAGIIAAAGTVLAAPFRRDDAHAIATSRASPEPQRQEKPRVGMVVKSRHFAPKRMERIRPTVPPRRRMCPSA